MHICNELVLHAASVSEAALKNGESPGLLTVRIFWSSSADGSLMRIPKSSTARPTSCRHAPSQGNDKVVRQVEVGQQVLATAQKADACMQAAWCVVFQGVNVCMQTLGCPPGTS